MPRLVTLAHRRSRSHADVDILAAAAAATARPPTPTAAMELDKIEDGTPRGTVVAHGLPTPGASTASLSSSEHGGSGGRAGSSPSPSSSPADGARHRMGTRSGRTRLRALPALAVPPLELSRPGPVYPLRTHPQVLLPSNPASLHYYERVASGSAILAGHDAMERRVWTFSAEQELAFLPVPTYFQHHPDLNPRIRYILIDWLFEVGEEFRLQRETVHLAVNYVDRFLSASVAMARDCMQLVGVTCLFLAAKLEEVRPPLVHDYARVTAGAHSADELRHFERVVLDRLHWRMSSPTVQMWINLFLNNATRRAHAATGRIAADPTYGLRSFGPKYHPDRFSVLMAIADNCIHHEDSLRFSYSMLAAAILVVHGIGAEPAVASLHGYEVAHLHECIAFVQPFVAAPLEYVPLSQAPPAEVRRLSVRAHARVCSCSRSRRLCPRPLSSRGPSTAPFSATTRSCCPSLYVWPSAATTARGH
jgi:hypothetical protein